MDEQEKTYHPAPVGQVAKPAEEVEITYLTDVTAPQFKVGEKGKSRKIERHWAEQLVAEGYAEFPKPPKAEAAEAAPADHVEHPAEIEHASVEQGTDSPGE